MADDNYYRLDQLLGGANNFIESFMTNGFAELDNFCLLKDASILKEAYNRLSLLEMESKFVIRRPKAIGKQLTRTDKYLDISFSGMKDTEEFENVYKLSKMIYSVPFEINMRTSNAVNLQVSEHFSVSYFDKKDHNIVKEARDSAFG